MDEDVEPRIVGFYGRERWCAERVRDCVDRYSDFRALTESGILLLPYGVKDFDIFFELVDNADREPSFFDVYVGDDFPVSNKLSPPYYPTEYPSDYILCFSPESVANVHAFTGLVSRLVNHAGWLQ
jgi:hypothetical protein